MNRPKPSAKSPKRPVLTSHGGTYLRWRYVANFGRTVNAIRHRAADPEIRRVALELRKKGVAIGPAEDFLTKGGREALAEASRRAQRTVASEEVQQTLAKGRVDQSKDYLVFLLATNELHRADSPFLRLALDERLLLTVAEYMGMWPLLHGISAWLNMPSDAPPIESQLWHRDPEDLKIIKVFIYLVDVDEERGPFTFIPETQPFGRRAAVDPERSHAIRVTDEEMRRTLPPETWLTCTGPAGTMILADTIGFHRGGKPTRQNRVLITFTYTSGTPFKKSPLMVDGVPDWATAGIQRWALRK